MIKVKVCGMRDHRNVRSVISTGPDYLGFIFYPESPRFVGTNPDKGLFQEVPAGIRKVGVFVDEEPRNVLELAGQYNLNFVQLHGNESAAYCKTITAAGLGIIKAFGIGKAFDFESLRPYLPVCDYFLFDSRSDQHGGTGVRFDWNMLGLYTFDVPFFLSGGISCEDATNIRLLRHRSLYAVDINSRFESEPGIKDEGKVKSFIQEIKKVSI
jgi:phosphoribosylanthranilate isomerase